MVRSDEWAPLAEDLALEPPPPRPQDRATESRPAIHPSLPPPPASVPPPPTRLPASGEGLSTLARSIATWFPALQRLVKSVRLYPDQNPTRRGHLEVAHQMLEAILRTQPDLALAVRDTNLLYGQEVVHSSSVHDGVPSMLWSASICRLTFLEGFSLEELERFAVALAVDYTSREQAGEDLATALWRLDLPHLRYQTFDVFSVMSTRRVSYVSELVDDEETDRLRRALAEVVGALSIDQRDGSDVIRMVDGALETPEQIRDAAALGATMFESASVLLSSVVARRDVEALHRELAHKNDHDALAAQLVQRLIDALLSEERPSDPSPALEFLLQLFDQVVEAGRFDDATRIVSKVSEIVKHAATRRELDFAQRLLARFGSDAYVARALASVNQAGRGFASGKVIAYLESLGPAAAPSLLARIGEVEVHEAREALCILLVRATEPDRAALLRSMSTARWEVAYLLLNLARGESAELCMRLIQVGLGHPHGKVRAEALRQLDRVGAGVPDALVVRALSDADPAVRMAAMRVIGRRRSVDGVAALREFLRREDLVELERREIALATTTYATAAETRSIPELRRLLLESGGLLMRRKVHDLQVAAAQGLLAEGSEEARAIVEKGARSLNLSVRAACAEALKHPHGVEPGKTPRPELSYSKTPRPELSYSKTPRPELSRTPLPDIARVSAAPPPDLLPKAVAPLSPPSIPPVAQTLRRGIHLLAPVHPVEAAPVAPPRLPSSALTLLPEDEQ